MIYYMWKRSWQQICTATQTFFAKGSTYKTKSKKDIPKPLILHKLHFPKISYTNFLINREKIDRFIACQSGTENGRGDGRGDGRGNGAEKFPTDYFN